jgi:hypothetical protein
LVDDILEKEGDLDVQELARQLSISRGEPNLGSHE